MFFSLNVKKLFFLQKELFGENEKNPFSYRLLNEIYCFALNGDQNCLLKVS